MIHKCRETCSCKESITSWLQNCICSAAEGLPQSTMWGFIKNIMKLEEKFWKQSQGQDSYANESANTFFERERSFKPPVPITVESFSAKAKNIVAKLLVEYERNVTIMEAEEVDALKSHIFSSTWSFKWLKPHNVKVCIRNGVISKMHCSKTSRLV